MKKMNANELKAVSRYHVTANGPQGLYGHAESGCAGVELYLGPSVEGLEVHDFWSDVSAAATTLGRKGGAAKSAAKTASSRANGAKGGRPRSWYLAVNTMTGGSDLVGSVLSAHRSREAAERACRAAQPAEASSWVPTVVVRVAKRYRAGWGLARAEVAE
jgi:hypothetical protein